MKIPVQPVARSIAPSLPGAPPLQRVQPATGLQDLAQSFGQVADMRARAAAAQEENFLRVEHEKDKAWAVNQAGQDRLNWTQTLQQRQQEAPPDPSGFTPKVLSDFDTYRDAAVKAAPSENARKMYDGMLGALREHIGEHALTFEASAGRAYRKQVLSDGIDNGSRTVAIDPTQYPAVRQERLAAINSSTDLGANEKAAIADKALESMSYAAAQTGVSRDPDAMLRAMSDPKEFAGHPYLPDVKPEHLAQLRAHAQALIAQRDSHQAALSDKAMKEANTATEELRKFWISGSVPDLNYQNEVLSKTIGTPFEPFVRNMISQATAGAAHGAMPLPRQKASIDAMEAELSKGSNPEAQKLLQYARQVTETQTQAYKENPWEASTRFGRLPAVPDTPLASPDLVPQYVAKVLPLMDGVEAQSGTPASPLQPAQAKKFSEQLKTLPPGPRSDVLGQIGAQLTAPRINALSEQIDKHDRPLALALKLGYGRTSLDRGVQETMLRGADAIRDKTVKADDTKLTGWRSEIAGMVRGTLGDAQAEQDVIDAAYYIRAGMDEPGYPGRAANDTAVKLAIGQPIERGGVKTILPKGMDESAFTDKLRTFTPEKLREMAPAGEVYVRGQKRNLDQLSSALPGMGMRRNGAGKYAPVSGGAFVTVDKEGQVPLLLEVQ